MAKKTKKSKTPEPVEVKIAEQQVAVLDKSNQSLMKTTSAFTIRSVDDENQAYALLKQIKDRLKVIEDKRKEIVKPINASVKQINSMFKELSFSLNDADRTIRQSIMKFRAKREEQAEKRRQKLLAKADKTKDTDKAQDLEAKALNVSALQGNSVTAKRWTFEVDDISKVPVEYLDVNSSAIRQAIRDGVRNISGITIYQEESLRVM